MNEESEEEKTLYDRWIYRFRRVNLHDDGFRLSDFIVFSEHFIILFPAVRILILYQEE